MPNPKNLAPTKDNMRRRIEGLEGVIVQLLNHIVTMSDGITGGTVISVSKEPVPISLAQLATDALGFRK